MISLDLVDRYRQPLLADLQRLVNMDSCSPDKADVDRVGAEVRKLLEKAGCSFVTNKSADYGDSFVASMSGRGAIKILMLAHMDTVLPKGTAAQHPYTVKGTNAYGPGTVDMKAGVLLGCYTMQLLKDAGYDAFGKLSLLVNSDEEVGSPSSRGFIEEQAKLHDMVIVLEGPQTRREIVSRRKGTGRFEITVHGRGAHAGVEPELGRNALVELAYQIIALQGLNTPDLGTTVNVCTAQAGLAPNAIPAVASMQVDVRAMNVAEAERIESAIRSQVQRTTVPDVRCTISGGFSRPPMEKTEVTGRLVALTQRIASDLGYPLKEISMGGATDGNFTAAIGVPTLDGMGPDGGLSHSEHEFLELPSIWERMQILIRVLEHLSEEGIDL